MPMFLSVEDVLLIHADQIKRYGGSLGVRDLGLLESAVAQAQAMFGGEYLHNDTFQMAAAYMFHIVQNHPFVDGNKRAGLAAALVFLDLNQIEINAGKSELYNLTMTIAQGQLGKQPIALFLSDRAVRRS